MSVATEAAIAAIINERSGLTGFIRNPDTMGSYDYSNDPFLLEIKDRGDVYSTTYLEVLKLNRLLDDCREQSKHWIYAVRDERGVFMFDREALEGLVSFVKNLPETSEFGRRQWIPKDIYEIPFDRAFNFIPKEVQ